MRRWILRGLALCVLVLAAAYLFDPDSRLKGLLNGELFFQNRPASAWVADARSSEPNTRAAIGQTLESGGAEALPVLVEMLHTQGTPEPRQLAADVLGRIGKPTALDAVPDLIESLYDPDPLVRDVAMKTLIALAPESKAAIPEIAKRFPEIAAIRAVSVYRAEAAGTIPLLLPLLKHEDPTVRWNASRALGKIGEPAKVALPELLKHFADPDPLVREHAAEALGDIGPSVATPETLDLLVKCFSDTAWKVRRDAVRSLGNMGPVAKPTLAEVKKLLRDENKEVAETALRSMRLIDPNAVAN